MTATWKTVRLRRDFAEDEERGDEGDEIEHHFTLTRVEPGKLWVKGMDGRGLGPIRVHQAITVRCQVGWTIAGVLGRIKNSWRLVEAWNVYPR